MSFDIWILILICFFGGIFGIHYIVVDSIRQEWKNKRQYERNEEIT